jgi:perosamine synthetase
VFVEIEPETYNLCPQDLERKVGKKSRAVMVVDVFGHPADWHAIEGVARRHGLALIDDSCEALGAEYAGKRLGRFGNAACFGFYPNKQITTGEGGAVVTDDDTIAALARSMRNQGRGEMGAWLEHERLGFNYRLDEMSAALGVSQLERIGAILERRAAVARLYTERLARFEWLRLPRVRPGVRVSWFVYVVTLAEGLDRDAVMRGLEACGIPVRAYFPPVHLQPYVRDAFGFRGGELPLTESVARRTIALPFHANLGLAEVEHVVHHLERVVNRGGPKH